VHTGSRLPALDSTFRAITPTAFEEQLDAFAAAELTNRI